MSTLPLFPLGLVLFPDGPLPLRIFEARYVDMVKRCMRSSEPFGVVLIREGREVGGEDLSTVEVGTSAEIADFHQLQGGLLGLSCIGRRRFRILERHRQSDGLHVGRVAWLDAEPALSVPPRHRPLVELLRTVLPELGEHYTRMPARLDDAAWVGHRLAEILPISAAARQIYLELDDPLARLDGIADALAADKRA